MCYFSIILNRPKETTATIAHNLRHPVLGQVDCVVGIGLSGTMPLVSVRQATGLPTMALRKPGVSSHGGSYICVPHLSSYKPIRYVILDDFTESGETIRGLIEEMRKMFPAWKCAGAIFYDNTASRPFLEALPVRLDLSDEIREVIGLLAAGEELP